MTSPRRVSVLLLAEREVSEELAASLGARRAAALADLLGERAARWARASFPDAEVLAFDGGLADAITAVLAGSVGSNGAGPSTRLADDDVFVLIAPELAAWRDGVGEAALVDLADGCAFSFGPVFDGGLYLLALSASAIDPLRDAAGIDDLVGRRVLTAVVTLAERAGFEVGMLRTERGLRTVDDVRALLVDPLTDADLRAALG